MAAERAERRFKRHEWREERQVAKEMAEAELAAGGAAWPISDGRWAALEDDISDTTDESEYSSDE